MSLPLKALHIKEAAARLKVPQYRLRDVEKAWPDRMIPEIFKRYIELLGLRDWVAEWIKANSELAERMGISICGCLEYQGPLGRLASLANSP
ncbi:MAG: hypothetical protein V1694_05555 [Candidatus Eisenbacteria bacterium]